LVVHHRDDHASSSCEKLASRIENADEGTILRDGGDEFAEFIDAERGNHPNIVKVAALTMSMCPCTSCHAKRIANLSVSC
jgi:hypothetical protein